MRSLKSVRAKNEKPKPETDPDPSPKVVGRVKMIRLSKVKPNDWNPNVMTPEMRESLRYGLETDGWIISQSLLVWGTDEKGKRQDIIIDGEHRWLVANELGFKHGPMVFLDGLSLDEAKKLTVKMDRKRGTFDMDKLGELLRTADIRMETAPLDLGFDEGTLRKLLELPKFDPDKDGPPRLDEFDDKAKWSKVVKCPKCGHEFKS